MTKAAKAIEAEKTSSTRQAEARRPAISDEGRKWLQENAEAIESINRWVEKNGLPLGKYRTF